MYFSVPSTNLHERGLLDFLRAVFVVELDLVVAEPVDVEAVVWQRDLRGVGVCVVVDDRVVGEGLLDVSDGVVHDDVAVGEYFSDRAVLEDDLLLAVLEGDLRLAVLLRLARDLRLLFWVTDCYCSSCSPGTPDSTRWRRRRTRPG